MVINVSGVVAPLGLKLIKFNCYQLIYLLIRFEARERSRLQFCDVSFFLHTSLLSFFKKEFKVWQQNIYFSVFRITPPQIARIFRITPFQCVKLFPN